MLMDTIKKNRLLYAVVEKLKNFLRPFYDNGSSVTAEVESRSKGYEPFYSIKQQIGSKNLPEGTF
jgi:hypothetical protein